LLRSARRHRSGQNADDSRGTSNQHANRPASSSDDAPAPRAECLKHGASVRQLMAWANAVRLVDASTSSQPVHREDAHHVCRREAPSSNEPRQSSPRTRTCRRSKPLGHRPGAPTRFAAPVWTSCPSPGEPERDSPRRPELQAPR
jgi:hypothetical protein